MFPLLPAVCPFLYKGTIWPSWKKAIRFRLASSWSANPALVPVYYCTSVRIDPRIRTYSGRSPRSLTNQSLIRIYSRRCLCPLLTNQWRVGDKLVRLERGKSHCQLSESRARSRVSYCRLHQWHASQLIPGQRRLGIQSSLYPSLTDIHPPWGANNASFAF